MTKKKPDYSLHVVAEQFIEFTEDEWRTWIKFPVPPMKQYILINCPKCKDKTLLMDMERNAKCPDCGEMNIPASEPLQTKFRIRDDEE